MTCLLLAVAMAVGATALRQPLAAIEGAANIAEEALLADDFAAAEAAFAEQSRDEAHRARLAAIIDRLAGTTRQRCQAEQKSLGDAVVAALDLPALAKLAAAAAEHRTAAQAALAFIFNDKQYPVPPEATAGWRPGVDVQPGQAEMEKRYAVAFEKYQVLEQAYQGMLLQLIARLKPGEETAFAGDPQPPLPEYLAAVEKLRVSAAPAPGKIAVNLNLPVYALRAPDLTLERALGLLAERTRTLRLLHRKTIQLEKWRDQLRQPARPATNSVPENPIRSQPSNGITPPPTQPGPAQPGPGDPCADLPPAARVLVALADEEYARAAQAAATLPQAAGFATFWQLTCSHAVLIQNRCRQGLQPHENWNLREINLYRLSLAERPLAINDKLQAMAKKHGEAMQRKKFFGHFDPDDARRTPAKRAALEGVPGVVGENITGGQDGIRSLWRWRSDAGHHRVLALPSFCEAGLAEVDDKETLDAGGTAQAEIQKLFATPRVGGGTTPTMVLPAASDPSRPQLQFEP